MPLSRLLEAAGEWTGISTLHDPQSGSRDRSDSRLRITPLLSRRFVRLEYTWSYQAKPQEGVVLIGHNPKSRLVSGYWADTWHMGHDVMTLTGTADPGAADLALDGSYEVAPGPDWGWRIDITADGESIRVGMVNITPEGEEFPAVEAEYGRA